MESKIFTPADAKKTLLLLRSITKDISKTWEQIIFSRTGLEQAEKSVPPNKKLAERIKQELSYYVDKINRYIKETEDLGCFVEEFKRGVINFPALYHERKIFLCWKQDEDRIDYWHKLDEGFNDRKQIRVYSDFSGPYHEKQKR